jgi:hypothetical protein
VAARRRGLGDVLHYFISEEEQERARQAARPGASECGPRAPVRWALCADPSRPLRAALAVDLAAALARHGLVTRLLSPVPPGLGAGATALWDVVPDPDEAVRRLAALAPLAEPAAALLVLPASLLGPWLRALGASLAIDGVLVPVDPGERGIANAAELLRALPRPLPARRLATLVLGARDDAMAHEVERRLAAAAPDLEPRPEPLGALPHDPARFRSLLNARPLAEVDAAAASARRISDVSHKLGA